MDKLKEVKASPELVRQLAIKLICSERDRDKLMEVPMPKNNKQTLLLLDCIEREILDLGPTPWGVFNGVTRYTSNHLKGKQGFGVVNRMGEKINRAAIKHLDGLI